MDIYQLCLLGRLRAKEIDSAISEWAKLVCNNLCMFPFYFISSTLLF